VIQPLGNHILLELWGVSEALLNDSATLEHSLVEAASRGGAHVLEGRFRCFEPQGISGVIILAESHVTIHTWPELGYAAVDVFTCGPPTTGDQVSHQVVAAFSPTSYEIRRLQRGVQPTDRRQGGEEQ
jgi:S-adenosylmethionine decarboxylase proenzyme